MGLLVLFMKALRAGERWITVHPHGADSKGQPVLVSEQKDGSLKVIGGAGGSLNHLRLTGVKPQGSYADEIRRRAEAKRDSRKKQRERDKAAGIYQAKVEAHKRISDQKREENRKFVEGVAAAMGWAQEDYRFNDEAHADLAEDVRNRLKVAHETDVLKRAVKAVELNRQRLIADADARAEIDLGEVPLSSLDQELSVQDIAPVSGPPSGLGYAPEYKARAEAAGLDSESLASEAAAFRNPVSMDQRRASIHRGETAELVRTNLAALRDASGAAERLKPQLVEARTALDLMRLDKRRKMAEREARMARKRINEATDEPKAAVIDIDETKVDREVAEDVANDLRTVSTRAFLSEVAKTSDNPRAALGRHIGVGAFNSVNALALAAGGAALVDRSVVDVLGISGAAEVLAKRLQSDLTPEELARVADGMEDFHLSHYMAMTDEALASSKELEDQVKEIELSGAENGGDLSVMQEINRRRIAAISESQRILGTALGEMEANASLVYALRRGADGKPFQVSMGDIAVEDAIRQLRAIGLERGDYSIETVAGNRVVRVTSAGLDRLSRPVNRSDLEQVRRNLDIIGGNYDEDGWLPRGVSDRPDLDMRIAPGIAPSLAEPFDIGNTDLKSAVRAYAGGRTADGDTPADIVADLQSADFFQKVGADRAEEYRAALDDVAPLRGADGKMQPAEALQPSFERMADEFVERRYGTDRSPLHRQKFAVDQTSIEALHRALAAQPAGVAAYKPIGELTRQDQGALREFFMAHVAKESPDASALRQQLEKLNRAEPERETEDMFGTRTTSPAWAQWRQQRDDIAARVGASSLSWPKYVAAMRGQENAYAAIQDLVRSQVSRGFAENFNLLLPDSPIKVGRTVVRHNLSHLDAVDQEAREARQAKERELADSLRNRVQGRYASGGVRDKLDDARSQQAGFEAAQMGFFSGGGDLAPDRAAVDRPLAADERYTVGHEAERLIGTMMPHVGKNFRPGQPVKLFRPTMSGGKNVARQRAIKMIDANKRVALTFGVGSGKTLIGLGAYTHLREQGKVRRGLFLVPSIVQGQYGGEALRFLKPGAFAWHAQPGASQVERIAAYKDPSQDFAVMTHQSFRDDMVHLGAKQSGITEEDMSARLASMSRGERKDWLKGVLAHEGISFDYLNVDEGHNTLNRQGKENSALANVVDAMSDNSEFYVNASGDPIKNDVSEAFSLLQKMDPGRYADQGAFIRKYGVDTVSAKDELRREMARFQYPHRIDPDVAVNRIERTVQVSDGQKKALTDLDRNLAKARLARIAGKVDVDAVKAVAPEAFVGAADDAHEAIARDLSKNLGLIKTSAIRNILDAHPESAKLEDVAKIAKERAGKPGVIFAHSLSAVERIRERLERDGVRVTTITGADSAREKEAKRQKFNPDAGEPEADILVASDAGATGMNAQRGQYLVQYDTPMTAMTHAQRNGRIARTGQRNDVDLIDLVSDHPEERRNRARLKLKYGLRDIMTTPMEGLDDTGIAFYLKQREAAGEVHGAQP